MKFSFILFSIHLCIVCIAQQLPAVTEQQLENLATENLAGEDAGLTELERFSKEPLNLNTAEKNDLQELHLLTALQADNFIAYRRLLGKIAHIYELQAVPGWDLVTIRNILPFISIDTAVAAKEEMRRRFRKGEHSILLRITQAAGKDETMEQYKGGPQRLFFRYRYVYKNLLQYGLVGEKDPGENFFSGAQKMGFDFNSIHLFVRNTGIIKALALGDFTVNMGQGLIQWQGLAFKKSTAVMNIKRQAAVLRPYSSGGEFYFHRGAGITIRKGKLETTMFVSLRRLSADIATDTVSGRTFFSSFHVSGYHRTQNELNKKNKLGQFATGATVIYTSDRLHIGINAISYRFSVPLQKSNEPYHLFGAEGRQWSNASLEYSYTHKGFHIFGEAAVDRKLHRALLSGFMISVDPRVDISLFYRHIAKDYQAINANAFTESSSLAGERGIYAGITVRPVTGLRLDAYSDFYGFAWLRYGADAPGTGRDFLVQLTYTPDRRTEIYTRFRHESKQANQSAGSVGGHSQGFFPKEHWRTHCSFSINRELVMRYRVELLWYDKKGNESESGFLIYMDCLYKPSGKKVSGGLRMQWFETEGYNARLYAYENDVLYNYSIPAFSGKGGRYYILAAYDLNQKIAFWLRWAQTIHPKREIGTSIAEASASQPEIKFQVKVLL